MFTECPHCQTLFRISPAQLEQANGTVRCCRCDEIFDAREQLRAPSESTATEPSPINPVIDSEIPTPTEQHVEALEDNLLRELSDDIEHQPESLSSPLSEETLESNSSGAEQVESTLPSSADPGQLLGKQPDKPRKYSFAWSLLALLALTSLLFQLVWFERALLIQHPDGAKLLEIMCQQLGCTLPPRKNTRKIEIVSRSFSVHPTTPNALQLHLTFISKTRYDQLYPQLQINLFNTAGLLLASRIFKPSEYLSESWQQPPSLMPAQREIEILLELDDPGENVTGFELDFL
ncbi:MAG: zinc-ribbon and DUF3426 domain-containing protein [Candidatus Polarisedimenticolaceae bacterium]|nr:zinc-ribbon and DUF3426 domain-containing protein [Candidatus Polarisedimenticolaceae bacterium]